MTSATVTSMSNDTTPPVKVGASKLVRKLRKPYRYLVLLSLAPAADALPMRILSTDPGSATHENTPYVDRAMPDTRVDSETLLLDPAFSAYTAYQRRIAQLRLFAAEDKIELSIPSEHDFFDFACTEPQTKAASLVLLDNGNLRAVWRSGQKEVGVQFYGGGMVQYLISREGDNGKITHTARRGTFEQFSAVIESSGLGGLLYE